MSVWVVVGIIVAFLLGLAVGSDDKTVVTGCKRCRGRNWHIWVEETDDPSVYRGIYELGGRKKYEVEANGVTNTLEKLADEIDSA